VERWYIFPGLVFCTKKNLAILIPSGIIIFFANSFLESSLTVGKGENFPQEKFKRKQLRFST
jgi:hypothetical protein